jgi:hypothetical protein
LIEALRAETAMARGAPFRGRVVSLSGRTAQHQVPNLNQFEFDYRFAAGIGNDMRRVGYWMFRIPTLESSGQFTTPFFHLIATRLLYEPHGISARQHIGYTRLAPAVLQALGVKVVIDDQPAAPSPSVQEIGAFRLMNRTLYAYRLADANLGQYSPTRLTTVATAREALQALARPGFDWRTEAVTFETLSGDLLPAQSTGLVTEDGATLAIEATSAGRSLLLLPLEFSHCLRAVDLTPGTSGPRLFRANLAQTGVVFERRLKLRIALRFGPFVSQGCRLADWRDSKALRVGDTVGWWIDR